MVISEPVNSKFHHMWSEFSFFFFFSNNFRSLKLIQKNFPVELNVKVQTMTSVASEALCK